MAKFYEPLQLELSNGIPVILQHYDGPVAATYWWISTGSTDESPKEAGFAHFLEHMLFKDAAAKESGKTSTGQTARLIESLGGDINAYTSFDQTVYHVTCAAHQWEKVLDHFGPIAKPQRFLAKDFSSEREVILEELRKNEDSPGRMLFQTLFKQTFQNHPYGRPVIGFEKTLKAARVGDREKFYRAHYTPARMGLILVGPILAEGEDRKKRLLERLEKYYGAKVLKPAPSPSKPRPQEKPLREKATWVTKRFDIKTPTISFSFRVPDLSHEDLPALDLLSGVLGMGELSRLYQKLFYQTSIVTDISSGLYVPKDPGMLYFQAEVDTIEKIETATLEMFKELRRICEVGPDSEEISRVLVNAESEKLYATQTADGLAGRLGFLRFVIGELDYDKEYLDRLRTVSSTQIRDVARKYLDYRRMSGVLLLPEKSGEIQTSKFEEAAEQLLNWKIVDSSVAPSRSVPVRSKKGADPIESYTLPSGIQVRFFHRPHSHVFSIHASALGGVRLELGSPIERPESDWGSSYLMALSWPKGTSQKDARTITGIVEGKAASLEGFAGRNSIGLQMTGLARDWNDLSGLFSEVLLDPQFPKEELDHARRIAEDSVRSVDDHSGQLCSKLFLENLFEKHPYGRMTHGSLESLKNIQTEKLRAFHKGWIRPDRLVLSISGQVKPASVEAWLSALSDQAKRLIPTGYPYAIPEKIAPEPALKAPRWVEKLLGREQLHILVGGLGTEITAKDRYPLRLLQTLLGGQSGRLFIELREKRSLAYTVSPISFEGIERGYVGTYIACSPTKRQEAEKGVAKVLADLAQKGPTPKEVERAKEFFLGRRAMDLQSDASISSHHGLEALYRMKVLPEDGFIKMIRDISPQEIKAVCNKYCVAPYQVTAVVG
ncbi:MAG: insulinase family protein [Bdellovibrio sp.]|nr:insulinase family protein [Bdellovibrio sp.]